jgi:FKBP-type peptidyl-prolyl cis-trans isomerase
MKQIIFASLCAALTLNACAQKNPAAVNDRKETANATSKTENGITYTNHTQKSGNKASEGSSSEVHYTIRNGKGEILESSHQRGTPIPVRMPNAEQVKGNFFLNAISMGASGDSITASAPIENMKKELGPLASKFQAGEIVSIGLTVNNVLTKEEAEAARKAVTERAESVLKGTQDLVTNYNAGKLKYETTPEGVKYVIHEQGTGAQPKNGNNVKVHYCGITLAGTKFDASFDRGEPIPFQIGTQGIIKGWNIGVPLLKQGGKATIIIPSALAYGQNPPPGAPIKPGDDLVFFIELVDVK